MIGWLNWIFPHVLGSLECYVSTRMAQLLDLTNQLRITPQILLECLAHFLELSVRNELVEENERIEDFYWSERLASPRPIAWYLRVHFFNS